MTKEQRPTSKIVQMSCDDNLSVLCEDGSIWVKFMDQHLKEFTWECQVEAHKEPVEEEPTPVFEINGKKVSSEVFLEEAYKPIDKLPVVGERYKAIQYSELIQKVIFITDKRVVMEIIAGHQIGHIKNYLIETFWGFFEELPDQEPTKEEQNRKSRFSKEVQEALEELKEKISEAKFKDLIYESTYCQQLRVTVIEVVSALEAREDKPEEKEL